MEIITKKGTKGSGVITVWSLTQGIQVAVIEKLSRDRWLLHPGPEIGCENMIWHTKLSGVLKHLEELPELKKKTRRSAHDLCCRASQRAIGM